MPLQLIKARTEIDFLCPPGLFIDPYFQFRLWNSPVTLLEIGESAKWHSQTCFIPLHSSFTLIKDCLIMAKSSLKVYRCCACGEWGVKQNLQSGKQGLNEKRKGVFADKQC